MKIAIIGSRTVHASIDRAILRYLPPATTEVISGGAEGVDTAAARVAHELRIPLRVFEPDYAAYGKRAPLMRNLQIIDYADEVLAFWDGASRGTMHVIAECIKQGRPVRIIPLSTVLPNH